MMRRRIHLTIIFCLLFFLVQPSGSIVFPKNAEAEFFIFKGFRKVIEGGFFVVKETVQGVGKGLKAVNKGKNKVKRFVTRKLIPKPLRKILSPIIGTAMDAAFIKAVGPAGGKV